MMIYKKRKEVRNVLWHLGLLLVLFMVMSIISVMGLVLFVPFERRKRAEGCVLLYGGMGHGHRMDDGE